MTFKSNLKRLGLGIFFALALAQCGEKQTLNDGVAFSASPKRPVVINSPITLHPGTDREEEITPPWFIYTYSVGNSNQNDSLYLVTYNFKISGIANGQPFEHDYAIDPSSTCSESSANPPGRVYLGFIPPGQAMKGVNLTSAAAGYCDYTDIQDSTHEQWYIQGFPKSDNNRYVAVVTGDGWFVNSNGDPLEGLNVRDVLNPR